MNNELLLLRQLLGTAGDIWLSVTLLAGFIVVLVFRPERVQQWSLFRSACWMLALSVVIPPVLNVLFTLSTNPGSPSWGMRSSSGEFSLIFYCSSLVSPSLQGLGILFGLLSLIPKIPAYPQSYAARCQDTPNLAEIPKNPESPPLGPAKHPWE
jgi:hypothetical protein